MPYESTITFTLDTICPWYVRPLSSNTLTSVPIHTFTQVIIQHTSPNPLVPPTCIPLLPSSRLPSRVSSPRHLIPTHYQDTSSSPPHPQGTLPKQILRSKTPPLHPLTAPQDLPRAPPPPARPLHLLLPKRNLHTRLRPLPTLPRVQRHRRR
jgi:hypothetical protein